MNIKFAVVFNRKKKLNGKGQAPIEIQVYQDRKRKFISTGISVTPAQWDKKAKSINDKHNDYELLNIQIKAIINKLEKQQTEHILQDKPLSIGSLNIEKEKIKSLSFVEFIKKELENDQVLRVKTKASHNNTVNKLVEFKKGKDIYFTDIDYSFVDDFLNFLRKEGLSQNTVHKQHKNLKKHIDTAIKKGYYTQGNPCKQIKLRWEEKKREVLVLDEINAIEALDLSKYEPKLDEVRDLFLFSCYTGLRISDATHLKPEYFTKTQAGYELEFVTQKVNKRAQIPLHSLFKAKGKKKSKPEIILEKYYNAKKEFIFPKLPEPFINRHLKVLATLAGISIKVTFHTARHSFGTYMANKIPLPVLMVLMQHSDIKTTMTYVNTSQELVKQGLMKVAWD